MDVKRETCPKCGANSWTLQRDSFVQKILRRLSGQAVIRSGQNALYRCTNCGSLRESTVGAPEIEFHVARSTKPYFPLVKSAIPYTGYKVGPYACMFFTDCDNLPQNQITYVHFMWVRTRDSEIPIFATACETNAMIPKLRAQGQSIPDEFAFGVFPNTETKHQTLGWSNQWSDIDVFIAKSLEVVREYLSVPDEPVEFPPSEPGSRITLV